MKTTLPVIYEQDLFDELCKVAHTEIGKRIAEGNEEPNRLGMNKKLYYRLVKFINNYCLRNYEIESFHYFMNMRVVVRDDFNDLEIEIYRDISGETNEIH